MSDKLFTQDQLKRIEQFLDFIRLNGGWGTIEIVVRDGKIKFINLAQVSAKTEVK